MKINIFIHSHNSVWCTICVCYPGYLIVFFSYVESAPTEMVMVNDELEGCGRKWLWPV